MLTQGAGGVGAHHGASLQQFLFIWVSTATHPQRGCTHTLSHQTWEHGATLSRVPWVCDPETIHRQFFKYRAELFQVTGIRDSPSTSKKNLFRADDCVLSTPSSRKTRAPIRKEPTPSNHRAPSGHRAPITPSGTAWSDAATR